MQIQIQLPAPDSAAGGEFLWRYLLEVRSLAPDAPLEASHGAFLSHCLRNFRASNSDNFQDLYVRHKLADKRDGFFVEFGALDGVVFSNTLTLERDLGWRGILAEPNPACHAPLKANRACIIDTRCVWSRGGERVDFTCAESMPAISTVTAYRHLNAAIEQQRPASLTVPTVSLDELLAEHRCPEVFDYLCVDTEGSEFDILSAFDFAKRRPRILTVEHNHYPPLRDNLRALLAARGFQREFELFSQNEDWYFDPALVASC
jgi:FkbM family methyltransferase